MEASNNMEHNARSEGASNNTKQDRRVGAQATTRSGKGAWVGASNNMERDRRVYGGKQQHGAGREGGWGQATTRSGTGGRMATSNNRERDRRVDGRKQKKERAKRK